MERGKRRKRRENREEKGEKTGGKREKSEEPRATWTSYQYLTVILTSFDHFNGMSYDMS